MQGCFSYSCDLFETGTIERMSAHFQQLLASIVAAPEHPIHALEILDTCELKTLLVDWNATAMPYDEDVCIHTLIERQVERTPERTAVVFGDERLSYAELNTRANRLAHFLLTQGVGPDQLVGICVMPSAEMLVGILGILKAGGAYVPMDPAYPAGRLAFMVEDSGVDIVLTNTEASLPEADSIRVLELNRQWGLIAEHSAENPAESLSGTNLAYMIYTSGSTGQPKGVLIEHRSVVNLMGALQVRVYGGIAERPLRHCLSTSISFDASVDDWISLTWGHELHVVADEMRSDTAELLEYLSRESIDTLDCAPSQLGLLLESGLLDRPWVPGLIRVGGEAIEPRMWQRLATSERTRAFNLYGPTECTVEALTAEIGADGADPVIGRPLANCRSYVLDEHGNPVPRGAVGEIWIGGDGLARGYHRRPELTAEKFCVLALPGLAPQRLYRTGDYGRHLADGSVSYLGRRDGLVKLRGFTIELGEVENAIASMPGVRGTVVLVREDAPGDPRLVAYVRRDAAVVLEAAAVRSDLVSKLPRQMVPSAYMFLDRFPLTPSGKIDRGALPAPDGDSAGTAAAYAAPETTLQRQVQGIWAEFLSQTRVGIDDNFFELGGHSLLATRVVNRINRELGINVALRTLFERPTIRSLALEINSLVAVASDDHARTCAETIRPLPRVPRKA
jgi:amino acid adenylation domain-containing protein